MKADFGVKNSEPPHGRQNYFRPEESLLDKEAYIGPVTSVSLDSAPFQCSKVKNIAPRHVLLVGRGPWVEIYCEGDDEVNFEAINSNHLVFECQEGGTIHGMRKCAGVFCDGVDGRNKDLWLLYGGKCIAFVTLDPESLTSAHDTGRHDNCFQKLPIHGGMYDESNIRYHFKVSDWIWDTRAVILNDTKGMSSFDILVALGLANNTVHLVNFSSTVMNGRWSLVPTIQRKVVCEIRCINYCQSLFGWAPSSSIINREELDLAIAVGTVSNEILVWNVLNEYEASELNGESTLIVKKRVIHRLIGHEGVIHSIHIGAGGKYIVSTSDDRTVRLWVQNLDVATDVSSSAETHLDVRRMVGHECCYTMLWSAYGHHARIWDSAFISLSNDYFDEASGGIVSTGEDSTIRLWRISDGKELAVLRGHRCKSIWKVTSDRKGTFITGGNDGTAKVWDVDYHLICNASYSSLQKKAITPFCGIRTEIIPSDDSNSDPIIVSDTNENEKKTSSGMVLPVDYKNVKKSNAKRGQNIFGFEFYGGDPHRKLIMASRSGSLISFDLSTCKWVKHGSWSKGITTRVYAVNPTHASCIAVHPCNNVIAVGTSKGEVILSSISDTENVHKLLFSSHKYHGIRSLHWLDSYNMLAFHVNGIILWWKLDIFSSEMDLEYCSVRKPSLRFVLSMKRDGLKVGSPTAYFHDNKTKLFYVGDSRGNISVFDCESGKVDGSVLSCLDIISFAHKKEHVTDIIASSNGKGIISVGNDGFLHEAHLVNHSGRIKLLSILRRPVSCLSNISFIWRESSKSKGEKIIVGGYNGNRFIVWDLSMGYQLLNIDSGLRNRQMKLWIQFHDSIRPASHCLAILVSDKSGPEKLFMHSHLHYINRASPSLYNLGVPCHGETILDVALLQCEARHKILMATGSNDCRIKLHCLEGMRSYLIIELPPHESCVRAVCFSKHNGSKSSLLVTTGGKLQMSFYRIEEQIDESFDVTFLGRSVPLKKPEVDQRMNAVHALPLEDCANYCMKSHIVLSGASDGALHLMEVVEHDGHSKRPQKLINLFQDQRPILAIDMKRFSRRNIIAVVGNTAGEVAVWDIPGIANIDHASLPDSPKCVYHGNQLGTNSMSIAFKRSGMSPIIVVATGGDDQAISCSILRLTLKDDASLQSPSVVLEQLIMAHESCASAIKGLHIVQDVHSQLRLYAVGYDQRLSLWSVDLKADCIPRLNFVSSTLVDIKDINCLGYATQHGQHGEETDCIVAAGEGIEVFSFPINIWNAAQAFMKCDYLLITCGAGFSADSGLSTYETMPDTYRELCNPLTLVERQRDFQLFWSRFAQKYRETLPHRGYNILEQWCFGGYLVNLHRKQEKRFEISPWWIYSSNVDGHFNRFSCFSETICEIHGCATDFRCSFAMGYSNNKKRFGLSWDQWNEQVENQKRFIQSECADSTFPVYVLQSGIICKNCSLPARPNVLLFHDTDDNMLNQINESRERYQYWESMMEDEIVYNNKHLVILELGAGLNVPAVRNESEEVFMDTWHRINELASKGSATLIRINPKDAQCHHLGNDHLISIFKKAESTLLKINQIVMYISRNNKIY